MSILYEKLKKYAVPAASVEDFRRSSPMRCGLRMKRRIR